MSPGWIKVAVLTALFVVVLVALNLALWRRLTQARAFRAGWDAAAFDASLGDVDPRIPPLLRELLASRYGANLVPHPDDGLAGFLRLAPEEVRELVARATQVLVPGAAAPGSVPKLRDVGALARYLDAQVVVLGSSS